MESFLKQDNATVDGILKILQGTYFRHYCRATCPMLNHSVKELFSKYKYYETVTIRNKASIKGKIPEIEEALGAIRFINKKKQEGESVKASEHLPGSPSSQVSF